MNTIFSDAFSKGLDFPMDIRPMAQDFVLADAGGSNSTWVRCSGPELVRIQANGFNPYVSSDAQLEELLLHEVVPHLGGQPSILLYYGAGCAGNEQQDRVREVLQRHFEKVEVHSDLLGAGRALFGKEEGVALILGTGMSACMMRGGKMVNMMPALGYLLGDEGSGVDIGRHFLKAYFTGGLPEVSAAFADHIGIDQPQLLREIYSDPAPNRKIASYLPFIVAHLEDEALRKMVKGRFAAMFELLVQYFGEHQIEIGLVGSVGYHFRHLLKEVAASFGLELGLVLKDPVEQLVAFHSEAGD